MMKIEFTKKNLRMDSKIDGPRSIGKFGSRSIMTYDVVMINTGESKPTFSSFMEKRLAERRSKLQIRVLLCNRRNGEARERSKMAVQVVFSEEPSNGS